MTSRDTDEWDVTRVTDNGLFTALDLDLLPDNNFVISIDDGPVPENDHKTGALRFLFSGCSDRGPFRVAIDSSGAVIGDSLGLFAIELNILELGCCFTGLSISPNSTSSIQKSSKFAY